MQISDEGVLAGWAGVTEGQHHEAGSVSVRKMELLNSLLLLE